uniref:Uncharacterized protein n=1 Tax=Helicotheca tamesis TaxID=374047 RepID=A0A7S2MCM0_9STRA|mmetsp:Transcript_13558/g.18599  ORF Transcript_13558/g.18599 Transcript_13558/m.18599 type:complete len:101 (+) Transcript_13558:190-492(+)
MNSGTAEKDYKAKQLKDIIKWKKRKRWFTQIKDRPDTITLNEIMMGRGIRPEEYEYLTPSNEETRSEVKSAVKKLLDEVETRVAENEDEEQPLLPILDGI